MEIQEPVQTMFSYTRRESHDCIIPEAINIPRTTNQPNTNSPTLKIEDCSHVLDSKTIPWETNNKRSYSPIDSPCRISDLSQSPERVRNGHIHEQRRRLLSVSPSHSDRDTSPEDEIGFHNCPSSPLLVAMRDAVDSLNKYEDFKILEKIGAGFFAEVFKVVHTPTDQEMVLKVNKRMTGLKKLKEVELLKKLQHPNILHYVGACVHKGQLHPLTEYMNGGALEQLIQNKSINLPWTLRLNLALDIAKGMEYLHKNEMFHRDLNSKNVLLRRQGDNYTAVVADFGLAAKTPNLIRMRRQQSMVGSPYWMAPEILNGKLYDEKADIFSYGIVVCELISRLDADPDDLRRRRDYGIDEDYMRSLPEVLESSCPIEFLELAFQCCKILPVERPDFTNTKTRLLVIIDLQRLHGDSNSLGETIQPMPNDRLSFHERPRSRSYSPPHFETESVSPRKQSKETIV